MKKRSLLFIFIVLFLCVSACKQKSYMPKPVRKKKCNCPRFAEAMPLQSVYSIDFSANEINAVL